MPRTIEITVPSQRTDRLVGRIRELDRVLTVRVLRGVSISPPGDVIAVQMDDPGLHALMRLLQEQGLGEAEGLSVTTSVPHSIVSRSSGSDLTLDSNNATWEEMEFIIGRESNMGRNGMAIMAAAGGIAVAGIASNALHLVVGAMLMAPAFEPLLRTSLGLVGRPGALGRGLSQSARAWVALLVGAAAAAVLLRVLGIDPRGGGSSYFGGWTLVGYWSSFSAPGVMASLFAAIVGAVLIVTSRSVLASGVMVALALIPAASLVATALVMGDLRLAVAVLARWALDVALVVGCGVAVLGLKRRTVQMRRGVEPAAAMR